VGERDTDFERGFITGKEDLNSITGLEQGELRAEGKKAWTNGISDHLPLQWQKLSRPRSA
jgi:hypothetical protein